MHTGNYSLARLYRTREFPRGAVGAVSAEGKSGWVLPGNIWLEEPRFKHNTGCLFWGMTRRLRVKVPRLLSCDKPGWDAHTCR